jgi:ABC-2 type transport system ATP-binding protein
MEKSIAISVSDISKTFILPHEKSNTLKSLITRSRKNKNAGSEIQQALKSITFQVNKGEFFGIVGRNGSGKSTLLKILAGIYQPTEGSVQTRGKLVPFIELGVGFNPELTGRENVYLNGAMLGFSKKEIELMYDDIVGFAELGKFMDQKLKNYSSGMQVRLAFSMATRSKADILLVDEVLAVGDADFQRKCFDYFKKLKRDKKTVIFVSHDMSSVREYCDRAILIENNRILEKGSANKIATLYTRMFIEGAKKDNATNKKEGKRWGTGRVKYLDLNVVSKKELISITLSAIANEKIDNPNFGFSIRDAAGQSILGSNSKIKKQNIGTVTAGKKIQIVWQFPNILQDGQYFVEPAVVGENGETWDWWEEAKIFTVYKEEKTPYPVDPNISLSMELL